MEFIARIQNTDLTKNAADNNLNLNLPHLVGDERRLKQVIINLIRNAIKFTHEGSISLLVTYSECELSIAVRDTGVGITAEEIKLLFNRFGILQRTANMNSEGLGLGLCIVKQILE